MNMLNGTLHGTSQFKPRLESELVNGEFYEYYPLSEHVVCAVGICGGRPTFKYTRLEVSMVLSRLATGESVQEIVDDYSASKISSQAIYEAIELARDALYTATNLLHTSKPVLERAYA